MTDIQLFVSYSSTVGYRARDDRWSNKIEYTGADFEPLLERKLPSNPTVQYLQAEQYLYEQLPV